MLRNVIESGKTVELYQNGGTALKRGSLVTKDFANNTFAPAVDGDGVDCYVLDADIQPMGHLADVEISAYDEEMDTVKEGERAILVTYAKGGQFATTEFEDLGLTNSYAVSKGGKFTQAATGDVSKFKYIGEYADGDKTLALFEVVEPKTI